MTTKKLLFCDYINVSSLRTIVCEDCGRKGTYWCSDQNAPAFILTPDRSILCQDCFCNAAKKHTYGL